MAVKFAGTILVDDEDLVRASTADMLSEIGFEVIEARSGDEALRELRCRGQVDVLITDHLMPGMTGVELARAAAVEWPRIPVLVVSGYSDAIGIDAELPRLEKPFRQGDLAASLSRLLPSAGSAIVPVRVTASPTI